MDDQSKESIRFKNVMVPLFIAIMFFLFTISLLSARFYRRRLIFSRRKRENVMVRSHPPTGAIIVANSSTVDDADDQFSKNPSPFCKYCILFLMVLSYTLLRGSK